MVAEYARRALLTEIMLTPKPGLVDRQNSGAHRDMNLGTFLASIRAISDWFPQFVEIGYANAHVPARDSLPLVRPTGVLCEQAMLQATHGVNTHKGAIFSLGLLCSAAGRLLANGIGLERESICFEVASICTDLVTRELNNNRPPDTAGERIFRSHGLTGARGEAMSGFSTVRSIALPLYDRLRAGGVSEDRVLLQVLLHLLAVNGDTNIVARGGLTGLDYVRDYARNLLSEGGALLPDGLKKIAVFDDELIMRRLSPGGSADLLAVTCFLAKFTSRDLNTVPSDSKQLLSQEIPTCV
jgi:triphosphoribosyl-dephospho-CoA synthase